MFKQHRPLHYYQDDKIYIITSGTINKERFFNNKTKKQLLKNVIEKAGKKFNIIFYAWAILDNHYHLLVKIIKGDNLPLFVKTINGSSSFLLNKIDRVDKRKIWFNYWDTCIRSEKDFWTRFNYIHHNPVKHGYEKYMEKYEFSSYNNWIVKKGVDFMNDAFERYPIIDFTPNEDY